MAVIAEPRPTVHDGLVFGDDARIAAWVAARIPGCRGFGAPGEAAALGILRDGHLVGGVVFSAWRPGARDVQVSGAVVPGFRIGPAGLRRVLRYAFVQLGCARVSVETGRRNKAARRFAERLGFKLEGVKRGGLDGRQDLILYGLLARECRFLKDTR